jgi:Vacuolar protein sorting-associated protein 62
MFMKFRLFFYFLAATVCIAGPAASKRAEKYTRGMLERSEIERLIQRFGPIVYFHPKEKFFPDEVGHYADISYIRCYTEERKGGKKVLKYHQVYATSPADAMPGVPFKQISDIRTALAALPNKGRNCEFRLTKEARKGDGYYGLPLDPDGSVVAPCYVHFVQMRPDQCIIQFIYFYAYNGPTVKLNKLEIGIHEGDWEEMDVHLGWTKGDWKIKRVHYAAHQQRRGRMHRGAQEASRSTSAALAEFPTEGEHPVAFAAQWGHASVHEETRLNQNLDTTKKSKYRWDCSKHYHLFAINGVPFESDRWWADYLGTWGYDGPGGPLNASWFITPSKRFYNLIDDPDATGGVMLPNKKKGKTRPFIFEIPGRLNNNFCVEFFEDGSPEGQSGNFVPVQEVPHFRVRQKQTFGLRQKTFAKSEDAFEINKKKHGKNFKYCFNRPISKNQMWSNTYVSWKDQPAVAPLLVRITGFEY